MGIYTDYRKSGIEQGKKLLVMTTQVMLVSLELAETHDYELTCHRQTNIKVFQVVLDIQRIITTIPGQIDRQQPIYFIDALGRSSSFHLEFVRSPEASYHAEIWFLAALLRAQIGSGFDSQGQLQKRRPCIRYD
jgi:hypothetical protein